MIDQQIFFPADNLKLEGILSCRENTQKTAGVIICHPHPRYGGDMHNNVVSSLVKGISQAGLAALRFNFRGVGLSEGAYSDGTEETLDVKAAINFMETREVVDKENIFLAGYSFGAAVGLKVAVEDKRVKGWLGISPPLEMYNFAFLKNCPKPKLIIAGDHDFVCSLGELEKLFSSLKQPKELKIIENSDHFLGGKEDLIVRYFLDFLKKQGIKLFV